MLTWLIATALAVALLSPDTAAGKLLQDLLIELPSRQLAKLTPARIVVGALVMAAIAAFIAFGKTDGLMLVARSVPEAINLFAAFDVATYVDVIGILLLTVAALKMRAAFRASCAVAARSWRWLLRGAKRLHFSRHRAMRRRRQTRKAVPQPSDDDDRGWCAPVYAWA
jgi:hypothetical protein